MRPRRPPVSAAVIVAVMFHVMNVNLVCRVVFVFVLHPFINRSFAMPAYRSLLPTVSFVALLPLLRIRIEPLFSSSASVQGGQHLSPSRRVHLLLHLFMHCHRQSDVKKRRSNHIGDKIYKLHAVLCSLAVPWLPVSRR